MLLRCLTRLAITMLASVALYLSALQQPRAPTSLSRRGAAAALLALPTLSLRPQQATALFGDQAYGSFLDGGPKGDLKNLANTQIRLKELAAKLKSGELRDNNKDDAIVVLQTLTIQFGGTVKLMEEASTQMPLLDSSETAKLTTRLADELGNVRQGCREASANKQLAGVEGASGVIDQYLALAGTKYALPGADASLAYSKNPQEFAAQYYGVFSCEGQGLERIPGSNSCKDTGKNKNPFPTKNLLDFDFLTGETGAKIGK